MIETALTEAKEYQEKEEREEKVRDELLYSIKPYSTGYLSGKFSLEDSILKEDRTGREYDLIIKERPEYISQQIIA